VDRLTPSRRSWLMSQVRSQHTSPEIRVRKAAHSMGLRFRLHRSDLPGRPDLTLAKHHTVIFVHGCFWHRHPGCMKASTPKSRQAFWNEKFQANRARDTRVQLALKKLGWRVLVIWECETKRPEQLSRWLRKQFHLGKSRQQMAVGIKRPSTRRK
jgi:DNA mismatch endonuclease (patch repair protein)